MSKRSHQNSISPTKPTRKRDRNDRDQPTSSATSNATVGSQSKNKFDKEVSSDYEKYLETALRSFDEEDFLEHDFDNAVDPSSDLSIEFIERTTQTVQDQRETEILGYQPVSNILIN